MLKRKYVVQKSVRISDQLARDLEVLSTILERPQNDLINVALENLMIENKFWFAQNIIVDFFLEFLNGNSVAPVFNVQLLKIELKKEEKGIIIMHVTRKELTGKVADDYEKHFDKRDELEAELRELATFLEFTPEIENYLHHRLNYRSRSEAWSYL